MNKVWRIYRAHHARQTTLGDNLKDMFHRGIQGSDPEILQQIEASVLGQRSKRSLPNSVKGLMLFPELFDFVDEPSYSDHESDSDTDNEADANPTDDALIEAAIAAQTEADFAATQVEDMDIDPSVEE